MAKNRCSLSCRTFPIRGVLNVIYSFADDHPVQVELPVQWERWTPLNMSTISFIFAILKPLRIEYFKQTSVISTEGHVASVGPILAKTNCTLHFSVAVSGSCLCTARTVELLSDRFVMEYHIFSIGEQRLAAKGNGLIVSYDYAKNEPELPLQWRQGMLALRVAQLARSALMILWPLLACQGSLSVPDCDDSTDTACFRGVFEPCWALLSRKWRSVLQTSRSWAVCSLMPRGWKLPGFPLDSNVHLTATHPDYVLLCSPSTPAWRGTIGTRSRSHSL